MRLAEVGRSSGLSSGSETVAMEPIQQAVAKFRHRVTSRSDYPAARHWKAMIDQIGKYGE